MPTYSATVFVRRRQSILDPEGKAIEHALSSLGYDACTGVRVGKMIELVIEAGNETEARTVVEAVSTKLLSNPIMEDFTYTIAADVATGNAAR